MHAREKVGKHAPPSPPRSIGITQHLLGEHLELGFWKRNLDRPKEERSRLERPEKRRCIRVGGARVTVELYFSRRTLPFGPSFPKI